jgi:hypothetical protein
MSRQHHHHQSSQAARAKRGHAPQRSLLYTRQQTAELLSCSVMTVIRLEARGVLKGLRLNLDSDKGRVYHRADDVHALAGKGAAS